MNTPCTPCQWFWNIYAQLKASGKTPDAKDQKLWEIAREAAKCAGPIEAKRYVDGEIAKLVGDA